MSRAIYRVEVRGEYLGRPAWRIWYSTRHKHVAEGSLARVQAAIGIPYLARIKLCGDNPSEGE